MSMQAENGYFDDVSEYSDAFEDGEYVLTLVRVESAEGGQYGPSLRWIWTMKSASTGAVVPGLDSSGDLYEWHQYSSTRMTPRVKHYPWVVALLGRAPAIGESGVALVKAVLGKSMFAYCARPDGDPSGRQKILKCRPVAISGVDRSAGSAPAYTAQGDPIGADDDEDEDALMARLEAARARKGAANRAKAGVSDATYKELFPDNIEELPL